jgi:hypothetical protein
MASSHQNWQYLGASGYIGSYTTTGGGGSPIVPRSQMDFLRLGVGRAPSAEYPDGYLGTIRSRRDDKGKPYAVSDTVLDSLRNRQTQRGYQRGVHKGERIDPGSYMWPEGLEPDRRLKAEGKAKLVDNDGGLTMNVVRDTPNTILAPAPHLVNDGKANVSANVPLEYNPRVAAQFTHLKPRWQ